MTTVKALASLLLHGTAHGTANGTARRVALVAALVAAVPVLASVAVPVSVEDLARSSDAVVRGRVVKLTARRSNDGRRIFTYAEVEPTAVWRGGAPAHVTVVVPGGVVGDIGERVDGAPAFSEGEEVVLFLGKLGEREFQVHGMAQGKFAVAKGQALPNLSRLAFVKGPALREGERRAEPMAVDELERRVREAR
jgi:hypothetical protein